MDYQVIIIGAGPGGYVAAIRAAQYGLKVAVIEEDQVGGTCLNRGCVPTKALLHSSNLFAEARDNFPTLGIEAGQVSLDWKRLHDRKREIVEKNRSGVEGLLQANGVDLLRGHGKVLASGQVELTPAEGEVKTLTAESIILAAGSAPNLPGAPMFHLPGVITSDDILEGDTPQYKSLAIIGGGVIGAEFADFYASIGTEVTVIELMPRLLPLLDKELASNLNRAFKKKGIKVYTGTSASNIEECEKGLRVSLECKGKEEYIEVDAVLVAVGRHPQLDKLVADNLDLAMNGRFVQVNDKFETSLPGVYAIGDLIGGYQLAHEASAEGESVAALLAGEKPHTRLDLVPSCVYTSPEISSIGLTEEKAKEEGIAIKSAKYLMAGNSKSVIEQVDMGFIKFVVAEETEEILGVSMICGRATDLISEFAMVIANKLTLTDLLKGMRPHPTYCEGITEALDAIRDQSIHTVPRKKR